MNSSTKKVRKSLVKSCFCTMHNQASSVNKNIALNRESKHTIYNKLLGTLNICLYTQIINTLVQTTHGPRVACVPESNLVLTSYNLFLSIGCTGRLIKLFAFTLQEKFIRNKLQQNKQRSLLITNQQIFAIFEILIIFNMTCLSTNCF